MQGKLITLDNGQTLQIAAAPFTRANAETLGGIAGMATGNASPDTLARVFDLIVDCASEFQAREEVTAMLDAGALRMVVADGSAFMQIVAALMGR